MLLAAVVAGGCLLYLLGYDNGRAHEFRAIYGESSKPGEGSTANPSNIAVLDTRDTVNDPLNQTETTPTSESRQPAPSGTSETRANLPGGLQRSPSMPSGAGTQSDARSTLSFDPRKQGFNYLSIATLPWRDAEEALAFLKANGLEAAAVPVKPSVDSVTARAKNLPHVVFLAEGIASPLRSSAKKAEQVKIEVERIGRKWQREQRGASDFSQSYWVLHRGS